MTVNLHESLTFTSHIPSPIVYERQHRQEQESHPLDSTLKLAEARANQLRHQIVESGTRFGQELRIALDHPKFSEHGHHHSRHVEKLYKVFIKDIYDARPDLFEDEYAEADLSAAMLFPYMHDLDQQLWKIENIGKAKEDQLVVKKGHAVSASSMVMGMSELYKDANSTPDYTMSDEEAWNITSTAAMMIFRHDEPEMFDSTFSASNDPASMEVWGEQAVLQGEALYRAFETDTLDMRTITPSQILEITRTVKSKNKFLEKSSSTTGTAPSYEEAFGEKLGQLRNNNEPIFQNISEKRWERIKLLTEAAYAADMGDMIAPYNEQIMRTLLTQYSRKRPFSCFQNGDDESSLAIDKYRYPSREERLKDAINMAFNGRGNSANSDDIRLLWEMTHVKNISAQSGFGDLPHVHQFVKDHVLMSALTLRQIGPQIMAGNMMPIDTIYTARLAKIHAEKARIEGQTGRELNGQFSTKEKAIIQEREEVKKTLLEKHSRANYTKEDIEDYTSMVDAVITYLQESYHVTEEEMTEYYELVAKGEDPQSLPFKNDVIEQNNFTVIK